MSEQDVCYAEDKRANSIVAQAELTHGTLESRDLSHVRPLYEETFGLRVVRHSKLGQCVSGRNQFTAVDIAAGKTYAEQPREVRWLVLLAEGDNLDSRYALAQAAQKNGYLKELEPIKSTPRGVNSFIAQDVDGNWWEFSALSAAYFRDIFDRGNIARA